VRSHRRAGSVTSKTPTTAHVQRGPIPCGAGSDSIAAGDFDYVVERLRTSASTAAPGGDDGQTDRL